MTVTKRPGRKRLGIAKLSSALSGSLLLAACGGGGGVSAPGTTAPPVAAPVPAPAPAPSPTPSPEPVGRSAEYMASGPARAANAGFAYDRSVTGKGVTIAVIDTGVDVQGQEFQGRISPDSKAFENQIARCATCAPETVTFGLDDTIGHGTQVASVALAARNGTGVHGVAPDATLLALKISAANLDGVTADSVITESDAANVAQIAPAFRHAVDKGAFVISMSLNGSAGGEIAAEQRAAMDHVRAEDRLVVQSVSNTTGEDSFSGQISENLVGADRANKNWFLFAVGVDADGNPRTQNGNAGALADRMIAATGNQIQVVNKDGGLSTVTGNSFAAPAVAGAAALLKQYWPELGGAAIARILLDTAKDAGAPGVDPVFGAGLLDVEKAMQPQASQQSFKAAATVLARFSSLTLSAPFGGSAAAARLNQATSTMAVLDSYGRDYRMTGAEGARARHSGLLMAGMLGAVEAPWIRTAAADQRLGFAASGPVGPWQASEAVRPAVFSFSPADGQTATVAANIGIGQQGGIAGSPLRGIMPSASGLSASWRGAGWSAGLASGGSWDARSALRVAHVETPLGLGLEVSDLRERGRALGAQAGAALGIRGAQTQLATLTARRTVGGVHLSGRATVGQTRVRGGSELMRFDGPIVSSAFSVEMTRSAFGGLLALGLSSPLRVERARATLLAPIAYDLVSGALATRRVGFDLSPSARELDVELGWSAALSPRSALRLGVVQAFDAGHVAGTRDTAAFLTFNIN